MGRDAREFFLLFMGTARREKVKCMHSVSNSVMRISLPVNQSTDQARNQLLYRSLDR